MAHFLNSAKDAWYKFNYVLGNFPNEQTFEGHDKEEPFKFQNLKENIFVSPKEINDGITITSQAIGGFGSDFAAIVVQGLSVASAVQPPEYNVGVQFNTEKLVAFARLDTNKVVFGTTRITLTPKSVLEMAYNNASHKWMVDYLYSGFNFAFGTSLKQGVWEFRYGQSVSDSLSMGSTVSYDMENRVSKYKLLSRFPVGSLGEVGAQFQLKDNGNRNEPIGKLYYEQNVADGVETALKVKYNADKSEFDYKVGMSVGGVQSRFSFVIDPSFTLMSNLEFQPASFLNASLCMFSKANETVRFGLNLNVLPQ